MILPADAGIDDINDIDETVEPSITADDHFTIVPNDIIAAAISDRAFRTYAAIKAYVREGHATFPRITSVAERFGLSESYLKRGIRELEGVGILVVSKRPYAGGFRRVNDYHFPRWQPQQVRSDLPESVKCDPPATVTAVTPPEGSNVTRPIRQEEKLEEEKLEEEPSSSEPAPPLRDDVEKMLNYLDAQIVDAGVRRPPTRTKKNRDAARLMLDRDGWDKAEIAEVIRWATHDSFWSANIGSAVKLREKYEQLRAQMNRAAAPTRTTKQDRNRDILDSYAEQWAGFDNHHEQRELTS